MRTDEDREARAREIARQRSRVEERSEDVVVPVVQEELRIGKREVDAGGVRIATHVSETPVEKTVTIREERVTIERKVVDRPIDERDEAFRDRSVDMSAVSEEPIITKRAHVVEEIRVHKDQTERTERVSDTLRHTDVQVSNLPGEKLFDMSPYEEHFRRQYGTRYEMKAFAPAYEFGERSYRGAGGEWAQAETSTRATWERTNPGTWEQFREAIRAGWIRVAGKRM